MKKIGRKLRSRRGASITFALLLFLVCAVISSAVIVAGTAAAGRMKDLAEADQRYYAVTSAAGMLRSDIDGKTVTVKYHRADGTAVSGGEGRTILSDASEKLVAALKGAPDVMAGPVVSRRSFQLAPASAESLSKAAVDCTIVEMVRRDGTLVFEISSGKSPRLYTLRVIFAANVKEVATDASSTTGTTQLTWKFHRIENVKAAGASGAGG